MCSVQNKLTQLQLQSWIKQVQMSGHVYAFIIDSMNGSGVLLQHKKYPPSPPPPFLPPGASSSKFSVLAVIRCGRVSVTRGTAILPRVGVFVNWRVSAGDLNIELRYLLAPLKAPYVGAVIWARYSWEQFVCVCIALGSLGTIAWTEWRAIKCI